MTLAQSARELFENYDKYKHPQIMSRRFTQADLLRWVKNSEEKHVFEKSTIGTSAEARSIYLLMAGNGPTKVLLWSQMHGDEATATMALVDILNFFTHHPSHQAVKLIKDKLALLMIPMINPDGAERFQRRTAQLIDMNRDALQLATPEARILKDVQQKHKPEFGFNLHDQDPRYTVGPTNKVAAIALLAPAADDARTDNSVRTRAKKVAAVLTSVLHQFVVGHVAKYDDSFEPRAFGDNIQKWGTSTVLIESGGWKNDRDKMFLRKLNFVGLVTALCTIADQSYAEADVDLYDKLQFNTKNLFDIIIRNGSLKTNERVSALSVDVGLNVEEVAKPSTGKLEMVAKIVDVGDLRTFGAFEEIDAGGRSLDSSRVILEKSFPYSDIRSLILQK